MLFPSSKTEGELWKMLTAQVISLPEESGACDESSH